MKTAGFLLPSSASSTGYKHSRSYRSLFSSFHFIPRNASSHEASLFPSKHFIHHPPFLSVWFNRWLLPLFARGFPREIETQLSCLTMYGDLKKGEFWMHVICA